MSQWKRKLNDNLESVPNNVSLLLAGYNIYVNERLDLLLLFVKFVDLQLSNKRKISVKCLLEKKELLVYFHGVKQVKAIRDRLQIFA